VIKGADKMFNIQTPELSLDIFGDNECREQNTRTAMNRSCLFFKQWKQEHVFWHSAM